MTREEAIKFYADEILLLELAPTINGDNGSSMREEWKRQAEIHRMAISALREQEKQATKTSEPCPWCKCGWDWSVIDGDFGQYVHHNIIKHCFHCGRRLEDT